VTRLLVGSYTATSGGHATGISLVDGASASAADVRTVAILDDPSFLALSGDRLYAVSETEDGGVHAFRFDGGALEHLWESTSGGDAPCHVRVDPSGTLIVTNYTSGTVTAIDLEAAETHAASVLGSDAVVLGHGGEHRAAVPGASVATEVLPDVEGPVVDRQEGPHAHQSIAAPDGTVLVADLGGDAIHEFRVTVTAAGAAGAAGPAASAPSFEVVRVHRVAPGVGPRHMAWHAGDLIVAGELDGVVHRLRRDASGAFASVASAPAFDGSVGETLLSHIEVHDGLVYVAARGRDTIAVFDPADGGLTRIAEVPCGGSWPRHFAFADGRLFVANQLADGIAVLPLGEDGVPGAVESVIPVGSPTCILPLD
jgi:6-phosphogluconolactonase